MYASELPILFYCSTIWGGLEGLATKLGPMLKLGGLLYDSAYFIFV